MIPLSIISEECSGGVLSNAVLMAVVIWNIVSASACLISSDEISMVFGIPVIKSCPLTAIFLPWERIADPTLHLICSAVRSPI